jgi:8-oxo-dGTP pyrophosphatase MutT (NUDIX family)
MKPARKRKEIADRLQVAALPYRRDDSGRISVMLVTSRETRRWVIPKGWTMPGRRKRDAAAREAFEEAGVKGRVGSKAVGSFTYFKRRAGHFELVFVKVYPLRVEHELDRWPEKDQRERGWFSPEEAARLVMEPGLSALLERFPERLARQPGGAAAAEDRAGV